MAHKIVMTGCILMVMVIAETSSFSTAVPTVGSVGYEEEGFVAEGSVLQPVSSSIPSRRPSYSSPEVGELEKNPVPPPPVVSELEKGPAPPSGPSHCGTSDPCQPPPSLS